MKTLILLCAMLPPVAVAGDDFNTILKQVESHYGKRHMKIPFMGMITFASHLARPAGVSDLKLAVIEGVGSRLESIPDFQPGPQWQPFIRTTSRTGERMVMYGRDEGHAIRTLMVVIEKDEAVVMQMRLDPAHLSKFLAEKSH